MLRAIAFGLAVGAGVQAWRNFPPDGPVTASSGILVSILGVLFAFLGGLWASRGRSSATATAVASAEATATANAAQTVNVAVFTTGQGAGAASSAPVGVRLPADDAAWFGEQRPQLEAGQLDGMDLRDLYDDAGLEAEET